MVIKSAFRRISSFFKIESPDLVDKLVKITSYREYEEDTDVTGLSAKKEKDPRQKKIRRREREREREKKKKKRETELAAIHENLHERIYPVESRNEGKRPERSSEMFSSGSHQ